MSNYTYVKNSRTRLKERLLYVMGGKCQLCGYDKCIHALEMHHINPEEKSFSIGQNTNLATEKVFNEAKKCVLVCANCHREIEYGLHTEDLVSGYNEERAQEILNAVKKVKEGEIKGDLFCSECGAPITEYSKSGKCAKCVNIDRRTVERPNREELKNLIRTVPFTHIAKDYGVSDKAISKWCVAEGLPSTKTAIKSYSDEEWDKV